MEPRNVSSTVEGETNGAFAAGTCTLALVCRGAMGEFQSAVETRAFWRGAVAAAAAPQFERQVVPWPEGGLQVGAPAYEITANASGTVKIRNERERPKRIIKSVFLRSFRSASNLFSLWIS